MLKRRFQAVRVFRGQPAIMRRNWLRLTEYSGFSKVKQSSCVCGRVLYVRRSFSTDAPSGDFFYCPASVWTQETARAWQRDWGGYSRFERGHEGRNLGASKEPEHRSEESRSKELTSPNCPTLP